MIGGGLSPRPRLVRIVADRLVTGQPGEVIHAAAVLIDGDRIVAAGADAAVPRPGDAEDLILEGATVLPGLIDAHVHLCFAHGENLVAGPAQVPLDDARQQAIRSAEALLRAGVTTVRDLGSRGHVVQEVRDAVRRGEVAGPEILVAGRPVTIPGGHLASFGITARGCEDMCNAVERLAEDGVDCVKVIATGGALTPGTSMGRAQFALDELLALTGTAHSLGLSVAAHAHGTEGIQLVVEAGVDTIEHCSWTDVNGHIQAADHLLLEQMISRRQIIVTAGPIVRAVLDWHAMSADDRQSHPEAYRVQRTLALWENARHARERGVGVALGTDSMLGLFEDAHDLVYRAQALVEVAGWRPLEVLPMMTSIAARAVTANGSLGVVSPGAFADLMAVEGDPTSCIRDLHNVSAVFRRGTRVA